MEKQENYEFYGERVEEPVNENVNPTPDKKTVNIGKSSRKINLNPVTARQAMVLSVIIGPPVSRKR